MTKNNDIVVGREIPAGTYTVSDESGRRASMHVIDLRRKPYHGVIRNQRHYDQKLSRLPAEARQIICQANQEGKGVVWISNKEDMQFSPTVDEMHLARQRLAESSLNMNKVVRASSGVVDFLRRNFQLVRSVSQPEQNLSQVENNGADVEK